MNLKAIVLSILCLTPSLLQADDAQRLLRLDHFVRVRSTAPSMTGQTPMIYVREVVQAGVALRGPVSPDRVVLFVHGAGTPSEVAFDPTYQDYSWMAFLSRAGFDVFAMDMTGYGRSARPAAMNDPCNLSAEQQTQFVPNLIPAPCKPTYTDRITTVDSDWNDIGAVVDHLRKLRGVDKVSLIGWSLGGPRAGGYASQHPEKVSRLVLLAPAYQRNGSNELPASRPGAAPFNTQSRAEFDANWDRQIGCPDQVDPAARNSVWSEMLAADPVGATWGTGVRRAPNTPTRAWNAGVVGKMKLPAMFVGAALDKQVAPEGVRNLFTDYGAKEKVFVDLACSSHNALWEKNHVLLFKASLEWLSSGSINGTHEGAVKLGY